MKLTLASALLALSVLGFATAASAEDAMMTKPDKTTMGTLVCRPAKTGETASAQTMSKTQLVCKPLDMKPLMAMEKQVGAMSNGPIMWQQLLSSVTVEHDTR